MVFRIARILILMLGHIIGHTFARLHSRQAADRYLLWAYLGWSRFTLKTFNAVLSVHGHEHIPINPGRPVVLLANHQSQVDIPALIAALGGKMGFVAKKELTRIPLLAYWMQQLGCIIIDRSNKAEAQRALNEAAAQMGANPIVVFPEGTRSKTGELLPFKPGGARLAMMANALVLPVRIEGTRNALEARKHGKPPFPVRITFYPTLDVAELPTDRAGLDQIRSYVEGCWRNGCEKSKSDTKSDMAQPPAR